VSPKFQHWTRAAHESRLPVYRDEREAGFILGLYTLTLDAQATIGASPTIPNLFIATGFSGNGFKLALSVAKGIAQMLDDEPVTAFDRAFFAPERFANASRASTHRVRTLMTGQARSFTVGR